MCRRCSNPISDLAISPESSRRFEWNIPEKKKAYEDCDVPSSESRPNGFNANNLRISFEHESENQRQ